MLENRVSLRDPDLNKKLPSYTITRGFDLVDGQFFGTNIDSDDISRNYWENAITAAVFLERLQKKGLLDASLRDPELFKKLLVKLHLQQSQGLLRNKPYEGQSETTHLSKNWQSEFRPDSAKVISNTGVRATQALSQLCATLDGEHWQNEERHLIDIARTDHHFHGRQFTFSMDMYFPPHLLEGDSQKHCMPSNDLIDGTLHELFFSDHPPTQGRSSIYVVFLNEAIVKQKVDVSDPNFMHNNMLHVFYPSAEYIPQYLELMRKHLLQMVETTDKKMQLGCLARAYQAGIRSQAFELVWNSEMMGIVNFYLKTVLNMKPISHESMDYKAFLFSPEAFEIFFMALVSHFNTE